MATAVDAGYRGVVLPHEHVYSRFRGEYAPQARAFLVGQLRKAAAVGVTDVVDLTAYTNPLNYLDLVASAPVRVHSCVGFYLERMVRRDVRARSSDQLAELLLGRFRRQSRRTSVVAIKVAAHGPVLTPFERAAFAAAAMVHAQTGLPVVTHSARGGEAHLGLLIEHGVPAGRVLVSHPELELKGRFRRPYPEVLKSTRSLVEAGASVCVTDVTCAHSRADEDRLRLLQDLIADGHAGSLMVSGDVSWAVRRGQAQFQGHAGASGYSLAIDVCTKLRRRGVDEHDLNRIFSFNPTIFYRLADGAVDRRAK